MSLVEAMRLIAPALRIMGPRAYGVVYLMTCLDSGKGYVGQTIAAVPYDRFVRHLKDARLGRDGLLARAIRHHGPDAFRFEILASCDSRKALNSAEVYFTRVYGTLAPAGYNLQEGGAGGRKSLELRKRLSDVHSSPETSKLHSLRAIERWADPASKRQIKETWAIKNALSAADRERKKKEKRDEAARARPAKIAARNESIRQSYQNPVVRERVGAGTRDSRWIHDGGEKSRRLKPGEALPVGWHHGRGSTYAR